MANVPQDWPGRAAQPRTPGQSGGSANLAPLRFHHVRWPAGGETTAIAAKQCGPERGMWPRYVSASLSLSSRSCSVRQVSAKRAGPAICDQRCLISATRSPAASGAWRPRAGDSRRPRCLIGTSSPLTVPADLAAAWWRATATLIETAIPTTPTRGNLASPRSTAAPRPGNPPRPQRRHGANCRLRWRRAQRVRRMPANQRASVPVSARGSC